MHPLTLTKTCHNEVVALQFANLSNRNPVLLTKGFANMEIAWPVL